MQTRKEKKNKRIASSLSLLVCGVLLSTSIMPTATIFAETTGPTTDSSKSVPTDGTLDADLPVISKVLESQTPTVPSTKDTRQPSKEAPTEETDTSTVQPGSEEKTAPSKQLEDNQDSQPTLQAIGIITDTWGTSPVSFDESTGVLTVFSGTLSENHDEPNIGNIKKNTIQKIVFQDDVIAPENSFKLFGGSNLQSPYSELKSIEGELDVSNVRDMSYMFSHTPIVTLDVSNWDTSKVINMDSMFDNTKIRTLNTSNWNTSKVTNMRGMFSETPIESLDVSRWNISNVTDLGFIFSHTSLSTLNVSNWNTSNVTRMDGMFYDTALTSLDVSRWDTSKVTHMYWMFDSTPIIFLDVSSWDTSSVTTMEDLFNQTKITTLVLGEKSIFKNEVNLPAIDTSTGVYTGKWERIEPVSPIPEYDSSDDFMNKYDGSQPGTYVWQKIKVPAQDLTVLYQDTDGNDISKSKTVSGNVGDKFNEAPITIESYSFKEVKENTPTEGTLTDKEQSITFIYTKNPTEETKCSDGKAISSENGNSQQTKSLPKTGEQVSSNITFAGITALLLASYIWLVKRRQTKKQ